MRTMKLYVLLNETEFLCFPLTFILLDEDGSIYWSHVHWACLYMCFSRLSRGALVQRACKGSL